MKIKDYVALSLFLMSSLFMCGKQSKSTNLEGRFEDSVLVSVNKLPFTKNIPFDNYDKVILGEDSIFDIRDEKKWMTNMVPYSEEGIKGAWGLFDFDMDGRDETTVFFPKIKRGCFFSIDTSKNPKRRYSCFAKYILEDRTGMGYDFSISDENKDGKMDLKETFDDYSVNMVGKR